MMLRMTGRMVQGSRFGMWMVLVWLGLLAGCATVPREVLDEQRRRERAMVAIEKARVAWEELGRKGQDRRDLAAYNAASQELWKILANTGPKGWYGSRVVETGAGQLLVRWDEGKTPGSWDARIFRDVDVIKKPRLKTWVEGARRTGLGVPLYAETRPVERNRRRDPGYPDQGQFVPATGWVEFSPGTKQTGNLPVATLRVSDPREVQAVTVGRKDVPLAADFGSTVNRRLGPDNFVSMALGGLLRPDRFIPKRGVYMTEPYRRDKIPVILVHGLASDPHIWQNLATAIESDPELGRAYQIWYFVYPTGLPVISSAHGFRQRLAQVRAFHDPDMNDPGQRRVVLVGHSMGGILSRMMVIDSGNAFYEAYFSRPLEKLRMERDERKMVGELLFFDRVKGIQRVVFISSPHRGSDMALNPIGRLVNWLVRLPAQAAVTIFNTATFDPSVLNPELRRFQNLGWTSIETLAPTHPYFKALEGCKITVPFHTIVGTRGAKGPLELTSDGVVVYKSAHLDGAESELAIPYWHSNVQTPEAVNEVLRILRLHLRKRGR